MSRVEQFRRFKSRQKDPLKQWKLSPVDMASLSRWHEYSKAKDAMIFHTDTKDAPWTIIRSDDKTRGRINCMRHFLYHLDYPEKEPDVVVPPDPLVDLGSISDLKLETANSSLGDPAVGYCYLGQCAMERPDPDVFLNSFESG